MTLSMRTEVLEMPFRDPFRIARTEDSDVARTVIVELELDGLTGLGESFPVPYYGETPATVMAVLPVLLAALEPLGPLPRDGEEVTLWLERSTALMGDALGHHGGAKAGLDIALHDLAGKALGLPLWQLLGTSRPAAADRLLAGARRAGARRRARAACRPLPGAQGQVGRSSRHRDARGGTRGLRRRPCGSTPTPAWQPGQADAMLPVLDRLGVELDRAALPRAPACPAALAAGAQRPAHPGR